MRDDQSTWTMDDTTRASNPGGIRLNPLQWFKSYPMWPCLWIGLLVGSIFLAFFNWYFWIAACLFLAMNGLYWQRVKEHFKHGCANPGVVVSLDPMLIAVCTDLTKGIGEYPAVKIISKKMGTICGQVPQVGTRVATVALYSASVDENLPHWESFDPRPVDCATTDLNAMYGVMNSFTEEDWQELASFLSQVEQPFRPGLFPVQPLNYLRR